VLGNALHTALSEILTRPPEDYSPLVQSFVARGPGALLELAARHGYPPGEGYASKCYRSWEIRESIYVHYHDLFAPAELYEDLFSVREMRIQ
jgi:hypothetical protein